MVGLTALPAPPLRTVGLAVAPEPPFPPPDAAAELPPPPRALAEGRVLTRPEEGGVAWPAPEDPVVGRVRTTGRLPEPPVDGGVTMGRPGAVGEVTPERPGSVRVTPEGTRAVPEPLPPLTAEGGDVGLATPLPDPVGLRAVPPLTPGILAPGALPPDRSGGDAAAPGTSFPWGLRTAVPATPG